MSSAKAAASKDRWVKCISSHGNLRGVAIQAPNLINEMAERHGIKGQGIQALGEAVMGALLIASYCKAGERINLNIRATGLIQQALVDAHPDGTTRGYVIQREGASGDALWGEGMLSILRTKFAEHEQPYIGTVPLVTGHLAKDLTYYWAQSEQIPSAVGLAVNVKDGKVTSAGGFLVQAMPGASKTEVFEIESRINEIQSLAAKLAEDNDPLVLLSQIFQDHAFMVLEEKPLEFKCDCSWERVQRALALIGTEELKSIIKEDKGAEVRCDFCGKTYNATLDQLNELLGKLESAAKGD